MHIPGVFLAELLELHDELFLVLYMSLQLCTYCKLLCTAESFQEAKQANVEDTSVDNFAGVMPLLKFNKLEHKTKTPDFYVTLTFPINFKSTFRKFRKNFRNSLISKGNCILGEY